MCNVLIGVGVQAYVKTNFTCETPSHLQLLGGQSQDVKRSAALLVSTVHGVQQCICVWVQAIETRTRLFYAENGEARPVHDDEVDQESFRDSLLRHALQNDEWALCAALKQHSFSAGVCSSSVRSVHHLNTGMGFAPTRVDFTKQVQAKAAPVRSCVRTVAPDSLVPYAGDPCRGEAGAVDMGGCSAVHFSITAHAHHAASIPTAAAA